MANYSVEAIVLARKDLGEADRLVSFFSRTMGKQKAVAKGVRRLTSRMAGHLEPGRLVKIFLIETKGLSLITQAQTQELYVSTRLAPKGAPARLGASGAGGAENNLDDTMLKLQALFAILEATDRLFDEQQRDSQAFDYLAQTLEQIKKYSADQAGLIVNTYVLNLLSRQGYRPELNRCVTCGEPLPTLASSSAVVFSVTRGGLVHDKCNAQGFGSLDIDQESLVLMRKMLNEAYDSSFVTTQKNAVISQISTIIRLFFEQSSDKHYKSARINDKLINK